MQYGLEITKKLSHRYGRYQVNELADMVYKKTADKRSGYGKIREIIGSWMFTDMKFLLKNVPRLQREGFFQFANLFEMKLSAADFANVKELVLSRKVDAEGYLSAAMMLLSQKGENSLSESERGQILDSTIEIITSAEHKNGLVGLSGKGLEYVRSENDFFYTTLEWFYKFTFDNKVLTNAQAKILFNTKIVMTEPQTPEGWEAHFTAAGFSRGEMYASLELDYLKPFAGPDQYGAELAAAGIKVRDFDMQRFDDDLIHMHALSLSAFAANPYYAPLPFEEFAAMYRPAVFLYEPGLA